MSRRKKQSGGQALILVTLALLAMCGMMGLSVDLGWSFFVQKQAQTAADGAALAAVQEAYARLVKGGAPVSGFSCMSSGTGSGAIECRGQFRCQNVTAATSNLNNGCQYAIRNGFDDTSSRQIVTMESNSYDGVTASLLPATTGTSILNISYWVTARTTQTIPQLFSAVVSRREGTVSAVATAAIAAAVTPGSFFGMDRRGDCYTTVEKTGGQVQYCGVDFDGGNGSGFPKCGTLGAGKANLCAPAGIILSSNCAGASETKASECSGDYAASDPKNAAGSSLIVAGPSGAVTDPANWVNMSGTPIAPTHMAASNSVFDDVFAPNGQPPILTDGSTMGSCGIPGGQIGTQAQPLGPFLYYSYAAGDASHTPTRDPIQFNKDVTFSNTGTCPTGSYPTGGTQTHPGFPTYVFFGGMQVGKATVTLDKGQYVMAGVKQGSDNMIFDITDTKGVIVPNSAAQTLGTMMITTDNQYPGLNLPSQFQSAAMDQGRVYLKNGSITMYGVQSAATGNSVPTELDSYNGVLWWQDRRNSTVGYDKKDNTFPGCNSLCAGDHGDVLFCQIDCKYPAQTSGTYAGYLADMLTKNHVTSKSPAISLDAGKADLSLYGAIYQPRGAWTEMVAGNAGTTCSNGFCPLQIVTGSLVELTGDTSALLSGPTNPILTFKPTLIH